MQIGQMWSNRAGVQRPTAAPAPPGANAPPPVWPRWRRKASARTQAVIASTTGTARMPTQGSWRPVVRTSISSPASLIERRGVRIEEVGLKATRATTLWPVEMPPSMPPALLARKTGPVVAGPHLVGVVLAGEGGGGEAGADLHPLGGVDRHQGAGQFRVELAVDRRAPAGRNAHGLDLDDGAGGGAGLAGRLQVLFPDRDDAGVGRPEGVFPRLRPVPAAAIDRVRPDLDQGAADRDASPSTLRATAPAATRAAVSRAEARPPPR